MPTVEDICALADQNGFGDEFRTIVSAATGHGLIPYPHEKAIRFFPPQDKRRYLLTIWAHPRGRKGGIRSDISPAAFAEFFPSSEQVAKLYFGDTEQDQVVEIAPGEVPELIAALDAVFEIIEQGSTNAERRPQVKDATQERHRRLTQAAEELAEDDASNSANRPTYLLIWNPSKSGWGNFMEDWNAMQMGSRPRILTNCGNTRKISVGDRVFQMLLGQREENIGIFLSGRVTLAPYDGPNWDKTSGNRTILWMEIEPDVMLNPQTEQLFEPETVDSDFNWHPQRSGITIPADIAQKLEAAWEEHVHNVRANPLVSQSGGEQITYREGAPVLVASYQYERDPRARTACLKAHGTRCAVCGFAFEEKYGEIGKDFIHVHHLVQIAEYGEEHEVDPERDLRPVCPNCHAMLHRRSPPYSIDELKEIIAEQ